MPSTTHDAIGHVDVLRHTQAMGALHAPWKNSVLHLCMRS